MTNVEMNLVKNYIRTNGVTVCKPAKAKGLNKVLMRSAKKVRLSASMRDTSLRVTSNYGN